MFQCLGLKPTDEAYAQASISTTIGGWGVRRILDHANGAFTASWHEAQVITGEKWTKPPDKDCSGVYNSQHAASAWLSARPSCMDGTDTPQNTALPLPVSSANPCSLLLPRALFASKPWTP